MKFEQLRTPAYVIDEAKLEENLKLLKTVSAASGAKILLAQKAFSMYSLYPLIGQYLSGTTASSLHEAKLGQDYMGKENHIFAPAYRDDDFPEILRSCDHIVFNSFSQWKKYKAQAMAAGVSCGLRVNPEFSTQSHALYDPCAPGSRFGIRQADFVGESLEGIEGLHFHTLCEQGSADLLATLAVFIEKFAPIIPKMKWINFGGGHHITKPGYDLTKLTAGIRAFKETYDVEVYLEPGEAIALNAGTLVATVMDIVHNDLAIAILDTSATCHMPDVLEVPYTPQIEDTLPLDAEAGYPYRLSSITCLTGDIIGDYRFKAPLAVGDRLIFNDMAIYTMVKNNTFNGLNLPDIVVQHSDGDCQVIRQFGYEDFKQRLS